jgi:Uma2 family endonuclease
MNIALKKEVYYTYEDYLGWDTEERYELIDGVPYMMSPAPTPEHQEISMTISKKIATFLEGKPCKVYAAPFDVRLSADDEYTVVQPDLLVVCDTSKIDKRGCVGAPDLVIEITSPSTANKDHTVKLKKYLEAGVKEYWIIDPESKSAQVYILQDDHNANMSLYNAKDIISGTVLKGLQVDLQEVFAADLA